MDDFLQALREVEPTATREVYTERSTVAWRDVGGLREIKEALTTIVDLPEKYPALFAAAKVMPPRGILFTGPTGTGKTLMARALAGETGLNFISISVPILFSKWLGESEKALHQIFKKAKQSAPCILFFDEIDTLAATRHVSVDGGAVAERMASQFFSELDNLSELSQVIVLGATNRPDLLDPALTRSGRLDYVLEFPLPSEEDRVEIFRVHTRGRPLAADVDFSRLAGLTEGLAGSDIAYICRGAAMTAITDCVGGGGQKTTGELRITAEQFRAAIEKVEKRT
jgi:transitional endoplasmic reticulum ATPase